ncbi:hypothetical protein L3Q82_004668 [Scortum barcoo]|uniref:Uncharacterized protein n=1 Tax=Scortum barcoo TaxID=214431 RepID=A0ACB8VHL3_9TELE|nr:hypothetical protein L3Q82_004668 [Scortum barcoo]
MESPVGALSSTPPRDSKKAWVLCTAVRPVGTNNSKRPIPNPKAQGSDPLVHRSELQHMAAELGSYKQAHTSSPPLTLGNSRVVEGPAPLKELGSRAQAMRGGIGSPRPPCHDCYPNHIAPAPHGPSCGCRQRGDRQRSDNLQVDDLGYSTLASYVKIGLAVKLLSGLSEPAGSAVPSAAADEINSLDETHALMTIVPEDVEIGEVEETLASIKSLGRVRVRGRNFNARLNRRMVLCESRETVREKSVPTEVVPIDGGEAWPVIIIGDTEAAAEEFNSKLRGLLQAEGKTIEDLKSLLPSAFRSTSSTESILHAVGDLLDKTTKPADGGNYGRLRMFSGALPTPPGEEPFDHWLEQAWLMVEETNCSDREKRRRLVGSVKGPALEIVKALRHGNPEASPKECLEALESAFGSAESGEDLYFAFRLMQQQTGEKLSDFLRRLERSLSKVIQRGGLPASHMNTARLEQLLRGAVASDLMLIQLRLRERRAAPPNFLQLLTEIRAEEEYEISRKKLSASVQQVHTNPEVDTRQADIQNLKAEIKELKSMVATVVTKSAHVKDDYREAKTISTPPDSENRQDAELAALKKELKRLKQKTSNKMSQQDAVVAAMTIEASKPVSHFPKGTTKKSDENFCYRCDKQQSNDATSNEVNCGVKKSAVTSSGTTGIPEGLVTIIFESWYHTYLPDVPIHPVSGLALWGLSESEISYPYRGDHGIDITQTLGIQVCCKENSLGSPSTATTLGEEDDVGCVLWQGPGPLTLPPGVGVLFQPMVVHSEEVNVSYFRVLVQNESLTETVIPVGTVIGHVYLTDAVIPLSPSKTTATEFDANLIDFGDSPVSEEWKERLRQKLSTRERSRRLAPADLEDVRKHLQELLSAGIIKESRSPYASPIVIVRKKNGAVRM